MNRFAYAYSESEELQLFSGYLPSHHFNPDVDMSVLMSPLVYFEICSHTTFYWMNEFHIEYNTHNAISFH